MAAWGSVPGGSAADLTWAPDPFDWTGRLTRRQRLDPADDPQRPGGLVSLARMPALSVGVARVGLVLAAGGLAAGAWCSK